MKRIAPLALLSGCYLGAHGSIDTTLRARPTSDASPQGAIDIGVGGADELESGALLLGVGVSPLVGRDPATKLARQMQLGFGGFYQRAFNSASPLRWYARLMFGGSFCGTESEPSMPDPSCMMGDKVRGSTAFSTGVGVALAASTPRGEGEASGEFGTVGLGVVYTYATDDVLGTGDFLGLELSFGGAADIITPLAKKKSD